MKKWIARCTPVFLLIALLVGVGISTVVVRGASGDPAFSSQGSGTETSLSLPGCQNIGNRDCTVQVNGTATTTFLGTGPFTTTITIHWGQATSNGAGGFCAPANGSSVLTAANGDQLFLTITGTLCEVGPTGLTVPHVFTGTYTITGGTGLFAGASGSGSVTARDNGFGSFSYTASGTIVFPCRIAGVTIDPVQAQAHGGQTSGQANSTAGSTSSTKSSQQGSVNISTSLTEGGHAGRGSVSNAVTSANQNSSHSTNTNTATSDSSSRATGGNAQASTGPITIPIVC